MSNIKITDTAGNKPVFTQWDSDRVLYIYGASSKPFLHFANKELARALVVESEAMTGGYMCKVPNFALQFDGQMIVSVFLQPSEGYTATQIVIPVKPKMKPQDYCYTENIGYVNWVQKSEEAQDLIDDIQEKLDNGDFKGDPFTYDDFTEEQLAALKGEPGDAATISVGTTTTLPAGSPATVENIGTSSEAMFNFGIPKGDKGDKGNTGAGFPAGGMKDNVLRKLSDDDYDTGWAYPSDMLSSDTKAALLQLAQKVAYIDAQGATYYQALYDALYPPKVLLYITAIYTQSGTVYDDASLDSLKDDLLVKAKYDDNTEPYVTNYTLSGTLTAGTSTVTVTYNGKTTTFTVTVTARPVLSSISAVYTQSGTVYDTDTLDSLKDDLVVTAVYSDSSTATVAAADYTLSGTLAEGTSTITVSYGGKTATFSVTVTAYWDFQWDYTMGKLEEQTGWTVDKSSSNASTEITSSAERFTTGTTQYYQCYISDTGSLAALRTMPNGIGVIQVTFSGYFGQPTSTNFEIIAAESASNRVRVCVNGGKFKLRDNSTIASATVLADFENNTEYTIRIVCKGTTADIYANGIKIGADIDMSTMIAGTSNSVITNSLAPGYYADLKSLQLKVGSY